MTLFALVDDLDSAFDAAHHALDYYSRGNSVGHPWFSLWAETMSDFRRDPRFEALAERLRLPEYWKERGKPQGCEARRKRVVCR